LPPRLAYVCMVPLWTYCTIWQAMPRGTAWPRLTNFDSLALASITRHRLAYVLMPLNPISPSLTNNVGAHLGRLDPKFIWDKQFVVITLLPLGIYCNIIAKCIILVHFYSNQNHFNEDTALVKWIEALSSYQEHIVKRKSTQTILAYSKTKGGFDHIKQMWGADMIHKSCLRWKSCNATHY